MKRGKGPRTPRRCVVPAVAAELENLFADDPFAIVAETPAVQPSPPPRRTELGDPFSNTLTLPCVIVEQNWRGIRVSVLDVEGRSPHAIASFFKGDEQKAIAEAERYAGAHGFTLVMGIQPEIVAAALEAGIAAARSS